MPASYQHRHEATGEASHTFIKALTARGGVGSPPNPHSSATAANSSADATARTSRTPERAPSSTAEFNVPPTGRRTEDYLPGVLQRLRRHPGESKGHFGQRAAALAAAIAASAAKRSLTPRPGGRGSPSPLASPASLSAAAMSPPAKHSAPLSPGSVGTSRALQSQSNSQQLGVSEGEGPAAGGGIGLQARVAQRLTQLAMGSESASPNSGLYTPFSDASSAAGSFKDECLSPASFRSTDGGARSGRHSTVAAVARAVANAAAASASGTPRSAPHSAPPSAPANALRTQSDAGSRRSSISSDDFFSPRNDFFSPRNAIQGNGDSSASGDARAVADDDSDGGDLFETECDRLPDGADDSEHAGPQPTLADACGRRRACKSFGPCNSTDVDSIAAAALRAMGADSSDAAARRRTCKSFHPNTSAAQDNIAAAAAAALRQVEASAPAAAAPRRAALKPALQTATSADEVAIAMAMASKAARAPRRAFASFHPGGGANGGSSAANGAAAAAAAAALRAVEAEAAALPPSITSPGNGDAACGGDSDEGNDGGDQFECDLGDVCNYGVTLPDAEPLLLPSAGHKPCFDPLDSFGGADAASFVAEAAAGAAATRAASLTPCSALHAKSRSAADAVTAAAWAPPAALRSTGSEASLPDVSARGVWPVPPHALRASTRSRNPSMGQFEGDLPSPGLARVSAASASGFPSLARISGPSASGGGFPPLAHVSGASASGLVNCGSDGSFSVARRALTIKEEMEAYSTIIGLSMAPSMALSAGHMSAASARHASSLGSVYGGAGGPEAAGASHLGMVMGAGVGGGVDGAGGSVSLLRRSDPGGTQRRYSSRWSTQVSAFP